LGEIFFALIFDRISNPGQNLTEKGFSLITAFMAEKGTSPDNIQNGISLCGVLP